MRTIITKSKGNLATTLKKRVKTLNQLFLIPLLFFMFSFLMPVDANASHFRYGTLSWKPVPGDPNTIEFKLDVAYRHSFNNGQPISDYIYFGDGTNQFITPTITSINYGEDWHYATATFTKTYANPGDYNVIWANNCCRIFALQNNSSDNYSLETVVSVGTGNHSPVTSLAPIIYLPANDPNASFVVPASDPDGDPLTFRLASAADYPNVSIYDLPAGISVSPTGEVTLDTQGKSVGNIYTAAVVVEDGSTKTMVDFLIIIGTPSNPPSFDYTVTPQNGHLFEIGAGQTLSFDVKAEDQDAVDVVSLQAVGLPTGVTFNSPTPANPVQTSFSWTPSGTQIGTYVINFIAQDNNLAQALTSVTIEVSEEVCNTSDPIISDIEGPIDPVQAGNSFDLSADVLDESIVSAIWYFSEDGQNFDSGTAATISNGEVSGSFTKPVGVYLVKLVAENDCEHTTEKYYEYVVVYDPKGGFVTGGGWIISPEDDSYEYMQDEGRANFGFVAKYKSGNNTLGEVDGNTNFQFKDGDFHFKSSSYEDMSLIISGARATYKGEGTVNGAGVHKFLIVAVDGDLDGGGGTDKFRLKVWGDNTSSTVIYDNQLGMPELSDAATGLEGGSIVIHKPKGKNSIEEQALIQSEVDILESMIIAPNPLQSQATVSFGLTEPANVVLKVYSFTGQEMETLFSGSVNKNQSYEVEFFRNNLATGNYFLKLTTEKGYSYEKQFIIE
ncbi:T9SS type A sorting domain-containing protein [Salegentibacter chungangensis]|uniref:T9SS type A sorting domain-containing protein n=1 Tax=Salegentibacter chungangensis TaxID=1335724 RepID=A0ABW3NTD9_9FLAO